MSHWTRHQLIVKYGDPMRLVGRVPRSATELYYEWSSVSPSKSLNRRERNERRWLGRVLENASRGGHIHRGVITDAGRSWVAFWREEVDAAEADEPGPGVPGQDAPVRTERRVS